MSCDYWYYNDITKQLYPGVYPMTNKIDSASPKVDWTKPIEYNRNNWKEDWVKARFLCTRKNSDGKSNVIMYDEGPWELTAHVEAHSGRVRNVVETKEVQVKVGIFINSCGSIFPRLVCGGQNIEATKAKPDEKLLHTYEATIKVAK